MASATAGIPVNTPVIASFARVFFTCFSPQRKFPCWKKGTPTLRKVERPDRGVRCAGESDEKLVRA
jgi:hypothetical protein